MALSTWSVNKELNWKEVLTKDFSAFESLVLRAIAVVWILVAVSVLCALCIHH